MYRLLILLLCFPWYLSSQKNVVLIIADDLGKDYCGFYSTATDTARMPNIRSLASKGLIFTNAWANPVCSPTRASMLTGRYGFRLGVGNAIDNTSSQSLDTAEYSIPKVLKLLSPKGYKTANIGKWHINTSSAASLKYPTTKFGYDVYSGPFIGALPDFYNYTSIRNGVSETISTYATTQNVNDAIAWFNTVGSSPFFLWLAFNAPHTPYHKPPDSLITYTGLTGTTAHINANKSLYFKASVEALDKEVGRLIAHLKAINKLDSTVFVFMGDNGNAKEVSQISDLTHSKGTVYQYGVNIPLVISGPDVVSGVNNELVGTIDLFSTILNLCGVSSFPSAVNTNLIVDSRDLSPYLRGSKPLIRSYAYTEVFSTPAQTSDALAIRGSDYKLIRWSNGNEEFYNVSSDINESNDILKGTLSSTEKTKYDELCAELYRLRGTNLCKSYSHISDSRLYEIDMAYSHNTLHLRSSLGIRSVAIYNVWGQQIQSVSFENVTNTELPMNLSQGIYLVQIQTQTGWITKKIFAE